VVTAWRPQIAKRMRATTAVCTWRNGLLVLLLSFLTGCSVPAGSARKTDTRLQRYVKDASLAYTEGHLDSAISGYRAAIRRAWAMDEPFEAGTAAYNLAACLITAAKSQEAQDWLLDARVELARAGASAGNVWLLEAKLATQELRFADADEMIRRASCSEPPCPDRKQGCGCCDDDPCTDHPLTRIPCLGPRLRERKAAKNCEQAYQAQIHFLRARTAAEQYDLATARREWSCAAQLVANTCDANLWAEREHIAALIHVAQAQYQQAGCHFDQEAKWLRRAGNYREIPTALERAAAAYEQAGLPGLAAERICRVARIMYGRGNVQLSWRYVQQALPIAEAVGSQTTRIRLSLLANELARTLSEQDTAARGIGQRLEPGMLEYVQRQSVPDMAEPVRVDFACPDKLGKQRADQWAGFSPEARIGRVNTVNAQ